MTTRDKDVDNEGQRDIVNRKISLFVLYGTYCPQYYCLACRGFISPHKPVACGALNPFF